MDRECLAIDVAGGIWSGRVIEVLGQLVRVHGGPRYLRSDNGPEFVATAILRWLADARIDTSLIDQASRGRMPPTNRSTESFRMSRQPAMVSQPRRCQGGYRAVASPLQRSAAALESRVLDANGIQATQIANADEGVRSLAKQLTPIRNNENHLTDPNGAVL